MADNQAEENNPALQEFIDISCDHDLKVIDHYNKNYRYKTQGPLPMLARAIANFNSAEQPQGFTYLDLRQNELFIFLESSNKWWSFGERLLPNGTTAKGVFANSFIEFFSTSKKKDGTLNLYVFFSLLNTNVDTRFLKLNFF